MKVPCFVVFGGFPFHVVADFPLSLSSEEEAQAAADELVEQLNKDRTKYLYQVSWGTFTRGKGREFSHHPAFHPERHPLYESTLTTRGPSSPTLSAAHAVGGVKESRK